MRPAETDQTSAADAAVSDTGVTAAVRSQSGRSLPVVGASKLAVIVALVVLIPVIVERFSVFYIDIFIVGAIYALIIRSLGILVDRAGMLAVCPLAFAAVGAYTVGFCNVHGWPGGLFFWMFLGGVASIPVGIIVGLPALRLRGINLAVITLSFSAAVYSLLNTYEFPGYETQHYVLRPTIIANDGPYFVLCWGVFVVVCIVIWALERRPFGTAWRCVARSERATAAMGMSVVRTKIGLFMISAFIAGIAGALMASEFGVAVATDFDPVTALLLFASAIMLGGGNPEGAALAGIFIAFTPTILGDIGVNQDFGNILFGVGAIQALSMGSSITDFWRQRIRRIVLRMRRRRGLGDPAPELLSTPPRPARAADTDADAMRIRNLTVRFGNVIALNDVSLVVPRGTVTGLIGPNGAGKSTLVDAVSGFIRGYEGVIELAGVRIDGLSVHRRARAGVRRTFQHERTAPELTAGEYVRLAARGRISAAEISDALAYVDGPSPRAVIGEIDVGARRLIEIAGCLAARPTVLLLDEPTAGLARTESLAVASAIAGMPERYGCAVLLIEHDMEVVSAACGHLTVLDFGSEIASGTPTEVLQHGAVISAYLGDQAVAV
ncbi:MAG: ATP-binding cassette domain-containing protein [Conexibacteraceae bacterium]|nr:ATP-binding cassette domain-containing protein [Conexibacteraceae bacterium]